MQYTPTDIAGVVIVDIEPQRDDRGFSSRSFCSEEFSSHGLVSPVARTDISYSYARGTLRGLHRQGPPHAEAKLVRCTRGAIADNTEVHCQVSGFCEPDAEQGFRWDDPTFGIEWPLSVTVISDDDASWPLLVPVASAVLR